MYFKLISILALTFCIFSIYAKDLNQKQAQKDLKKDNNAYWFDLNGNQVRTSGSNGSSNESDLEFSPGNMLLSYTHIDIVNSRSRGYESIYAWDKKSGKNKLYFSPGSDEFKVLNNYSVPTSSMNELAGKGEIRIESTINEFMYYDGDEEKYEIKFLALAYNSFSGKAKVHYYNESNNKLFFYQDLPSEPIEKIKDSVGEIRFLINRSGISLEDYDIPILVAVITAWNTHTGKNCTFVHSRGIYKQFYHWEKFNVNIPEKCINDKGKIMLDMDIYNQYSGNCASGLNIDHLVYNTYNHGNYVQRTAVNKSQFGGGHLPYLAYSKAIHKSISFNSAFFNKDNSADLYLKYNNISYSCNKAKPAITYVNLNNSNAVFGQINGGELNAYFEPASTDYATIESKMKEIKSSDSDDIGIVVSLARKNTSTFTYRYIMYNPLNARIEILSYNVKEGKFVSLFSIENALLD